MALAGVVWGGNGSRRFLKMGNMTACLYAHGKDPEPERERLVIGAVLECVCGRGGRGVGGRWGRRMGGQATRVME